MKSLNLILFFYFSSFLYLLNCLDVNNYSFYLIDRQKWSDAMNEMFDSPHPINFTIIPLNYLNIEHTKEIEKKYILLVKNKSKHSDKCTKNTHNSHNNTHNNNNTSTNIPTDFDTAEITTEATTEADNSTNIDTKKLPVHYPDFVKQENTTNDTITKLEEAGSITKIDLSGKHPIPSQVLEEINKFLLNNKNIEHIKLESLELLKDIMDESEKKNLPDKHNKENIGNLYEQKNNSNNEEQNISNMYEIKEDATCDISLKLEDVFNRKPHAIIDVKMNVNKVMCLYIKSISGNGFIWLLLGVYKEHPNIDSSHFPTKRVTQSYISKDISVTQPKNTSYISSNYKEKKKNEKTYEDSNDDNKQGVTGEYTDEYIKKKKNNNNKDNIDNIDNKNVMTTGKSLVGSPQFLISKIKPHVPGEYYVAYINYRPFEPTVDSIIRVIHLVVS